MCAYYNYGTYDQMTQSYQDQTSRCNIRKEHYPYDGYLINLTLALSAQYDQPVFMQTYSNTDPGSIDAYEYICYSELVYFQGEKVVTCSNFNRLDKEPSPSALNTIFSALEKYILCYDCSVEGYETESQLKVTGLPMKLGVCLAEGNKCKYYQYYDSKTQSCKSCSDQFPNCAACDSSTCSMCLDGFFINENVYDYSTLETRTMCVYNTCPVGTCKNGNTSSCIPSNLDNCLSCSLLYEYYGTQVMQCEQCQKGYLLELDPYNYVYKCVKPSWGLDYGKENTTHVVYNFFVASSLNLQVPDPVPDYYSRSGLSPQNASYNLQSVIYLLNNLSNPVITSKQVVANIYLGKGDHFFMQCTSDNIKTVQSNGIFSPCLFNDSILHSNKTTPLSDNIIVTVQPLECKNQAKITADQGTFEAIDTTAFESMCVNLDIKGADNRPIIYVNEAYVSFNITGNWTFRNLIFDGSNQFAFPWYSGVMLGAINQKLCTFRGILSDYQYDYYYSYPQFSYENQNTFYQYFCDIPEGYLVETIPTEKGAQCGWYNDTDFLSKFQTKKESTLKCSGNVDDPLHFVYNAETFQYLFRKNVLFNLYGMAEYLSLTQKPPELHIINCDFQYFVSSYESLINVQTESLTQITGKILSYNPDNYQSFYYSSSYYQTTSSFTKQSKNFYLANGQDRGAIIDIQGSIFQHSRFCKGLIVYRAGYFEPEMRALTNLTHLFMTDGTKNDVGSRITIQGSRFTNLNVITSVNALAQYDGVNPFIEVSENVIDAFDLPAFIHKGIVLNIEDFGGPIEVRDSVFEKNMHFIPKISYKFRNSVATGNSAAFLDSKVTQEYKMTYCDMQEFQQKYFFSIGFSQDDDLDLFFNKFERLGVIYISRNQAQMILTGNTFENNIGTFGGAITINSPNVQSQKANQEVGLIIRGNKFLKNMAYFSGNAIYVRSTLRKVNVTNTVCGGVQIQGNIFKGNIGTKIHNGGAVSAVCTYLTDASLDDYKSTSMIALNKSFTTIISVIDQRKFTINMQELRFSDNDFTENYSGLKGTAIYVKQYSFINIDNNNFFQNGPVYASLESIYSPYSSNFLKYQAYTYRDSQCSDELLFLQNCDNSESDYLLMPRVRGAVYVEHCQENYCLNSITGELIQALEIKNSIFKQNDAGPALDYDFTDSDTNPTASHIFVEGGISNIITNCEFVEGAGQSARFFPSLERSLLKSFFPPKYFESLTSSLIVFHYNPQVTQYFQTLTTSIQESNFIGNRHMQVVGLTDSSLFSGSLVRYINVNKQNSRFLLLLQFESCKFSDNKFLGEGKALIKVDDVIMKMESNVFNNNGYISDDEFEVRASQFNFQSSKFQFRDEVFKLRQLSGAIYVDGHLLFSQSFNSPKKQYHEFTDNTFSFLASEKGAAYSLMLDSQDALISGNTFSFIFTKLGGNAIYSDTDAQVTNILVQKSSISYTFSLNHGAVYLAPGSPELVLRMYDSTFLNNFGELDQSIYGNQMAKLYLENVNFKRQANPKNAALGDLVRKAFFSQFGTYLESLVSIEMLTEFFTKVNSKMGSINIEMTKNQAQMTFGGVPYQESTYEYFSYSEIINCVFENITAQSFSAVSLLSSPLRIFNSPELGSKLGMRGNTATLKGIIGAQGGSEVIAENLILRNNYASGMASGIYSSNSVINLINPTFLNNTAEGVGTVVLEADSTFTCDQCKFYGNRGNDSSTLFANNNRQSSLSVTNSQFENNTSEANLINMFYSNGVFENCTFTNNIASKVNNGITLISSILLFKGNSIRFTLQEYISRVSYEVDTGFFNLNYRSQLRVESSTFENCRGAIAGVLYATGSSSVSISKGSAFLRSYSQNGDTLYTSLAQSLIISDSLFMDNSNSDLYLDQTPGQIVNTTFVNSFKEAVSVSSSSVTFTNNTFKDGLNFNSLGKGVYCKCLNATFTNNTFQNLSAARGGAIFLLSAQSDSLQYNKFLLEGNRFSNCTAQQGGAVLISDAANATFIKNSFLENKAHIITPPTSQTRLLSSKGLGGGVYYSCINDDLKALGKNCEVRFQDRNIFSQNDAANDGGAMLWVTTPFTEDGTNIYQNNTAFYGGDVASFPSQLKIEFVNDTSSSNGRQLQDGMILPKIAPGKAFSFLVYILDQNDQVYKTESSSKAILKDVNSDSNNRVSIYNGEVVAREGVFNFSQVTITATPGTEISLKLEIQGLQTFGNSLDFVDQPLKLDFGVRKCVAGEQLQADNSCKWCAEGTYLYDAPEKEVYCKTCSRAANCYGGNIVAPLPQYWRSSNVSENFIKCPNGDACLGGNQTELTGTCAVGYQGILCGQCIDFYKKAEQFKCTQCPDNNANTVQIVIVGIVATVLVSLMVRSTLNSATRKKPVYSVYLKIIANHLQIIGAIQNIEYNWPEAIQKFEDGQSEVTSSADRIFSFDCFIMNNSKSRDHDSTPVYYNKLLIFGILPGILAGIDFLYWFTVSTINHRNYSELRSKFTSTLVVLLFLVHPNIAKTMFLSFNCLDVDGVFRLREDVSSICYEGIHFTYMLIVVIPSIVVWALGIPFFALALLIRNRRILALMQKKVITESEAQEIMTLKVKYGFLFQGFNPRTFYWEIVIMFRKIGIIMSTVFFSTLSPELQVLIVLLIIILSMFLQIKFAPYYTTTLNQMENYSLQVAAVTLYSGMFYVTGRHYDYMDKDELNWFFLFLIILPNLIFSVYWGLQMRIEILKEIHKFNKPLIFRVLACGSYKKFKNKHLQNEDQTGETQVIVKDGQMPTEYLDASGESPNNQDGPHKPNQDDVFGVPVGLSIRDSEVINVKDIALSIDIKKNLKNDSRKKRRFIDHEVTLTTTPHRMEDDEEFTKKEQLQDETVAQMTLYKEDDASLMNFKTNQESEVQGTLTARSNISKVYPITESFGNKETSSTKGKERVNSTEQKQYLIEPEISALHDFEGTFHKPILNTQRQESPRHYARQMKYAIQDQYQEPAKSERKAHSKRSKGSPKGRQEDYCQEDFDHTFSSIGTLNDYEEPPKTKRSVHTSRKQQVSSPRQVSEERKFPKLKEVNNKQHKRVKKHSHSRERVFDEESIDLERTRKQKKRSESRQKKDKR